MISYYFYNNGIFQSFKITNRALAFATTTWGLLTKNCDAAFDRCHNSAATFEITLQVIKASDAS